MAQQYFRAFLHDCLSGQFPAVTPFISRMFFLMKFMMYFHFSRYTSKGPFIPAIDNTEIKNKQEVKRTTKGKRNKHILFADMSGGVVSTYSPQMSAKKQVLFTTPQNPYFFIGCPQMSVREPRITNMSAKSRRFYGFHTSYFI